MMQSKRIAITGGIGSGKSTFCNILKKMGYPVYSCDEIYREMLHDPEYLSGLEKIFPGCFVNGVLNKAQLSELVFTTTALKEKLEAYAHPRIIQALQKKMQQHEICFAEVPLLFEGGYEVDFDAVIALVRNEKERIASVAARDHLTREQVLARIQTQFPPELLAQKGCYLIENDASISSLEEKARDILIQLGIQS